MRKYELLSMEDGESIAQMFGRFQTIINGLKSLCKSYTGYINAKHVDKILISLLKQWRPLVTVISQSKDLTTLSMDEFLGTLTIHGQELNEDVSTNKGKSVALKVDRKTSKITPSKTLKADQSSNDSNELVDEDSESDEMLSLMTSK